MIVLIILVVLISVLTGNLWDKKEYMLKKLSIIQMEKIRSSINQFQLEYKRLPNSFSELTSCEGLPSICTPLAKNEELIDSWGTPFRYSIDDSGTAFKITSLGADLHEGGSEADADFSLIGP